MEKEYPSLHETSSGSEQAGGDREDAAGFALAEGCLPEVDFSQWPESGYPPIEGASLPTLDDLIDPDYNLDYSMFDNIDTNDEWAIVQMMDRLRELGVVTSEPKINLSKDERHKHDMLLMRLSNYIHTGSEDAYQKFVEAWKLEYEEKGR